MGMFSWITGDTNESIYNIYSDKQVFSVYMITEEGRVWKENAYEGYGVFGGKDIYELIGELNNIPAKDSDDLRSKAIDLVFKNNTGGDLGIASDNGVKVPKLVRYKPTGNLKKFYHKVGYSSQCPKQGVFD